MPKPSKSRTAPAAAKPSPSTPRAQEVDPDQVKLTASQADRLAAVSGVSARAVAGLSVAEIADKFRFQIEPGLLLFRRICGRVVKRDPVTGTDQPVPFATVHVEDTDCSFLGFFPVEHPWGWFFPFRCRREVVGTARTDECGNFCVWIPRFDIDWVLRFRRERHCFPIIFERPSLRDILGDLLVEQPPFRRPIPEPDPEPFARLERLGLGQAVADRLGPAVARRLSRAGSGAVLGSSNVASTDLLDSAAFEKPLPPPLPKEFQGIRGPVTGGKKEKSGMTAVQETLAQRLRLDVADLASLDLGRFIGPFKRCFNVLVPEWVPIIDVPDITFRVTQDTDGDGTEETIYSEGYFQVRWNAGAIGPVVLSAGPNALAGVDCGGDLVPCGNVPAIVLAGRMPVVGDPTIYDPVNGYAVRPNRPHPGGAFFDPLPNPDAQSPFMGALSLFGCNRTDPTATHYRVLYKHSTDGGATFTSFTPFVGRTWPLYRLNVGLLEAHWPVADASGWYPIALPPPAPSPVPPVTAWLPQDLLLDWPSYAYADGRYVLKVELGTGGVASSSSAEVAFNIDNSSPLGPLTVEWRRAGFGAFQPLVSPCPVVRRGVVPVDVEFRVTLAASATHLQSARLTAEDCGQGSFDYVSGTTEHWHQNPADNSETLQAIYGLQSTAAEGAYSFSATVVSRAFNPSDGGHLILPNPWEYNPGPIYIVPRFSFGVINAN